VGAEGLALSRRQTSNERGFPPYDLHYWRTRRGLIEHEGIGLTPLTLPTKELRSIAIVSCCLILSDRRRALKDRCGQKNEVREAI